jgi:transposase
MQTGTSWPGINRADGIRVTPQERGHCDASIKRLEKGCFRFPTGEVAQGATHVEVKAADLMMILDGVDLGSVRRQRRYSREAVENP